MDRTAIGLVIVGILAGLFLARSAYTRDNSFSNAATMLQAVFTAGALIVAAYWYIVERKGQPHAELAQTVKVEPVGPDLVTVEASVRVKNIGRQLLTLTQVEVRLQQIWPDSTEVNKIFSLPYNEWPKCFNYADEDCEKKHDKSMFNETELQWSTSRFFDRTVIAHKIEPGETELLTETFIVPCFVKIVRVATNVLKKKGDPNKKDDPDLWWRARNFVEIGDACDKAKRWGAT